MNNFQQSFIDYIQQDINNTYKERDEKDTGSVEMWQSYVSYVNDDEEFYSYLNDEFDAWLDNGELELRNSDPRDVAMSRFIYDAVMNYGGKEDIYEEFKNEMSNFIDVCASIPAKECECCLQKLEISEDEFISAIVAERRRALGAPSVVGTINVEMPSKDEIIRINMLTIDNLKREFNKERETLELEISEYMGIKRKLEAKLKKADEWTALQAQLDAYICQYIQNVKEEDDDEYPKLVAMTTTENHSMFSEWLDTMIDQCFENYGNSFINDLIRSDILDAQCGDGRRLLWQSFKDEMADVSRIITA